MACSEGSCTCGKKKGAVAEEHIHLVKLPGGERPVPNFHMPESLNHLSMDPDLVEVRFKNGRKAFFKNTGGLELAKEDRIIVSSGNGYDLGTICLSGKAARNKFSDSGMHQSSLERVIRKATIEDLKKWLDAKKSEYAVLLKAREIAARQGRDINIRDAEFMGDGQKVSIYFSAPEGVDTQDLHGKYTSALGVSVELCPAESI